MIQINYVRVKSRTQHANTSCISSPDENLLRETYDVAYVSQGRVD